MGEFKGKQIMYRDMARALADAWARKKKPLTDITLCRLTADGGGESKGFVGALNDNKNTAGEVWQRDCGFMQIGIDAKYIGTEVEARLRTESKDLAVYWPVVEHGADAACNLFFSPWVRDGKATIRKHHPWYADRSGWATWNQWWVWARPWLDHWHTTGRYIQQACAGVANYYLVGLESTQAEALQIAKSLQAHFEIEGTLGMQKDSTGRMIVKWTVIPPKPKSPPADGVGPRPVTNDGR